MNVRPFTSSISNGFSPDCLSSDISYAIGISLFHASAFAFFVSFNCWAVINDSVVGVGMEP